MDYFLNPGTRDRFLAKRQVNLIGGASGAGKTRMIFQLIKASQEGTDFLGMKTVPTKWAYVSGDRGAESVEETMEDIGVKIPIFSMVDKNLVCGDLIKKVFPQLPTFLGYMPEIIFVDGFTSMVPGGDPNDYDSVAKWLANLQRYCQKLNLSILGSAHATKAREGDMIRDARQRILGSTAWAGFSQDIIILDRIFKKNQENLRTINILRRNGKEEIIQGIFNEGRLELDTTADDKLDGAAFVLEGLIPPPGSSFDSHILEHLAKSKGISRASFYRWLHSLVEDHRVIKENKGSYQVLAGAAVSLLGEYETSKHTNSEATNKGEAGSTRSADSAGQEGDGGEEGVRREVSEVLEVLQRRTDDAGAKEARQSEAPGAVRSLDGRGEVRSTSGERDGVQEDPESGDAIGDRGADEESGDGGGEE